MPFHPCRVLFADEDRMIADNKNKPLRCRAFEQHMKGDNSHLCVVRVIRLWIIHEEADLTTTPLVPCALLHSIAQRTGNAVAEYNFFCKVMTSSAVIEAEGDVYGLLS